MTNLINYCLHLADNALILAQRNAELCGHGPILEQDIAITNISLDLIGQSRNFYQYATQLVNDDANIQIRSQTPPSVETVNTGIKEAVITEDTLAYTRKEREYRNCLLVEQPNGDWAQTILRQFFFSAFQYFLYGKLQYSSDPQLAAISAKALKEVSYHLRWSSEWVIRLGDGTNESHERILKATDELWRYTGELFNPARFESALVKEGISTDLTELKKAWIKKITEIFNEATLPVPENTFMQGGGKDGNHTEHMGYILSDLQYMQLVYPNCEW